MGLDILTAQLRQLQQQNPTAANNVGWLSNIGALLCLEEFLLLLADLGLLSEFKAALNALIALAAVQVGLLEVEVAELEATITLLETFINTFKSLLASAENKLNIFPFSNPAYLQCPPVQAIEEAMASILATPSNFVKKLIPSWANINLWQYRLLQAQKQLQQLNLLIASLQAQILAWQAVVNAIAAQFHV